MSEPLRSWPVSFVCWILPLVLFTLINTSLALPSQSERPRRETLLGRDDSSNDDSVIKALGPGSDGNGEIDGGGSMSSIGDEPVTVQLGAGFVIGCVLGVVGYALVKLARQSFRNTREASAARRATMSRRERRRTIMAGLPVPPQFEEA